MSRPEADAGTATAAGGSPPRRRGRGPDPDRRARLEEERRFLMRSLRDLEAEHDAGDLDDEDHAALRDDYTVRAAAVLRELDGERRATDEVRAATRRSPGRTVAWVGAVLVFGLLAGVLVAQAAGRRDVGETISGDIRQSTRDLLLDARGRFGSGDLPGAISIYDEVLQVAPTNAEALTYRSWLVWLSGDGAPESDEVDADAVLAGFEDALASEPGYPDALVFRAIVLRDLGRVDEALASLDALDPAAVPPFLADRVAGLRAELEGGGDPLAATLERAASAARAGDAVAAIEAYDEVLAQRPDDVSALAGKGLVLGQVAAQASGEDRSLLLARALEQLDRAAASAPDDPIPVWYRALVLSFVDQDQEAIAVVDDLLERDDLADPLRRDAEALRSRLG